MAMSDLVAVTGSGVAAMHLQVKTRREDVFLDPRSEDAAADLDDAQGFVREQVQREYRSLGETLGGRQGCGPFYQPRNP